MNPRNSIKTTRRLRVKTRLRGGIVIDLTGAGIVIDITGAGITEPDGMG
jgi:hypothetical protein